MSSIANSDSPSSDLPRSRIEGRRTLGTVKKKVDDFERRAVRPALGGLAQRIDLKRIEENGSRQKFHAMLASYAGHLKHSAAMTAWQELWVKHGWLEGLFERRRWSLTARWSARGMHGVRSLRAQYWGLARHAGKDSLVFFQVGRFIEFYGPQRFLAVRTLGLRCAALPRAGYAFTAGFPAQLSGRYAAGAIRQGLLVVEVRAVAVARHNGYAPRPACAVLVLTGKRILKCQNLLRACF